MTQSIDPRTGQAAGVTRDGITRASLTRASLTRASLTRDGVEAATPARASDAPPSRGWRELGNHLHRVLYAWLGSPCLPAFLRNRLMRVLGFRVARDACIWAHCSFLSSNVDIGAHAFINVGFFHDGSDTLVIGENVRIGQFVRIITATHVIGPPAQRCTIAAVTAPVRIEQGCWIGAGVTILPGVTVREGCVVGAGAVVTASTAPNGLYVGTPARRVRDLPV